jgi:hypothetical protein
MWPPSMLRLDVSALLGDDVRDSAAAAATGGVWKRERGGVPDVADAAVSDTKRSRPERAVAKVLSDTELLEDLNHTLADAPAAPPGGEGGAAAPRGTAVNGAAVAVGGAAEDAAPRSRWEDDDEDDDKAGGVGGAGASNNNGTLGELPPPLQICRTV